MDLQHLTSEERNIIYKVIKKDQDLQEEDQKLFDEIKDEIQNLTEKRTEKNVCEVCRKTAIRDGKCRKCPRCQRQSCAMCIDTKKTKEKGIAVCLICKKERILKEMSGAWILQNSKVEKRKFIESDSEYSDEELQMSSVTRIYDGIHGLSPSEQLRKCLHKYSIKRQKIEKEESEKEDEPEVEPVLSLAELANLNVNTTTENESEEEVTKDEEPDTNTHEGNGYTVVAGVYSFDDFSLSTKEKAINEREELEEHNEDGKSSVKDEVDYTSGFDESEFDENPDELDICPVHTNGITISDSTVNDYDIIVTPTAKRKVMGLETIAIPKSINKDDNDNNSSFEDTETEDVHLEGNEEDNESTLVLSLNEKPTEYIPNNLDDDECDEGYANYSSNSLDLSLHGSYINSYYGD